MSLLYRWEHRDPAVYLPMPHSSAIHKEGGEAGTGEPRCLLRGSLDLPAPA